MANAGVFIEIGQEKILIDALCRAEGTPYRATPPHLAEAIIGGNAPFDRLSAVLFSHRHSDHYCPQLAASFARQHPATPVVVPAETGAAANIFAPDLPPGRHARLTLPGITIEIISTVHDGGAYQETRNYAYRLSAQGITLLHLGDTGPSENNLNILRRFGETAFLLVNFPFITLPSARKRWTGALGAKHLLILHLPSQESDKQNWRTAAAKAAANLPGYHTIKLMTEDTIFYHNYSNARS
ncbi:MAG: MBL fold metallo-hydrolase [Sporomusaceae bacterium]|nr:MBL fold metallo-hydrolase [Sporomusaceae bacterium]